MNCSIATFFLVMVPAVHNQPCLLRRVINNSWRAFGREKKEHKQVQFGMNVEIFFFCFLIMLKFTGTQEWRTTKKLNFLRQTHDDINSIATHKPAQTNYPATRRNCRAQIGYPLNTRQNQDYLNLGTRSRLYIQFIIRTPIIVEVRTS